MHLKSCLKDVVKKVGIFAHIIVVQSSCIAISLFFKHNLSPAGIPN